MILTDKLWAKLENFIPAPKKAADGGGRPAYPRRHVLEGILWVLMSGARWKDLPSDFPCYKTYHHLFQEWQKLRFISYNKSNRKASVNTLLFCYSSKTHINRLNSYTSSAQRAAL